MTDAREWQERRDLVAEAVAIARRLADDATIVDVMIKSYGFRQKPESLRQRLEETAESIVLLDRLGDPSSRWGSRYNRIQGCMEAGDLDEVDRRLR